MDAPPDSHRHPRYPESLTLAEWRVVALALGSLLEVESDMSPYQVTITLRLQKLAHKRVECLEQLEPLSMIACGDRCAAQRSGS